MKQLSSGALIAAQNAPATARVVVFEVENVNLVDTASVVAKGMYMKYEPVDERYCPFSIVTVKVYNYILTGNTFQGGFFNGHGTDIHDIVLES
ncbi:REF/SRPP-like protein At3g05500 [Daucus carota subsp. sativus]|uniref:REF/SRPP-like protein At3g05500 n=1 Tax=Daucus carota subsp. sativus TaxID=79200 RepID=UPI003083D337